MARSRTNNQGATATNVSSGTAKCRVSSIVCLLDDGMANNVFLQVFNNSAPNVGTTVPDLVILLPKPAVDTILGQNIKGQQKVKVALSGPKGGIRFDAGLSYAVTTTGNGSGDPASTDKPEVSIYYQPESGTFSGS